MATMYAWTEIKHGNGVARPGDSVTAKALGIDDDEFEQLVLSRAVRQTKYPQMDKNFTGSPRDWILEQRKRELADIDDLEDALAAVEVEALNDADEVVEVESEKEDE